VAKKIERKRKAVDEEDEEMRRNRSQRTRKMRKLEGMWNGKIRNNIL
jgi:hypothetical protein